MPRKSPHHLENLAVNMAAVQVFMEWQEGHEKLQLAWALNSGEVISHFPFFRMKMPSSWVKGLGLAAKGFKILAQIISPKITTAITPIQKNFSLLLPRISLQTTKGIRTGRIVSRLENLGIAQSKSGERQWLIASNRALSS